MPDPFVVGSAGTSGVGAGNLTVDLSNITGWAPGDLLIVEGVANNGTVATPAALTELEKTSGFGVWYRFLESGDTTITITRTGSNMYGLGYTVIRDHNGLAPELVTDPGLNGNYWSANLSGSAYDPSTGHANVMWLMMHYRSRGITYTSPSGSDNLWLEQVGGNIASFNVGTISCYAETRNIEFLVGIDGFDTVHMVAIGGGETAPLEAGWWIEVWDLDNTVRQMDDDPPVLACQFEKVMNDIGAGRVTFPASWDRLSEVCDPPNDVTSLIKVFVRGTFRYAFRSDQIEYEYDELSSTVTVSGPGYEVIVDDGDVPAFDYPTNPSLSGDWVYGEQTIYDYGFDNATYIAISTATAGAGTATWQQYSLTFTGTSDTTRLAVIGTTESETWYIANATVTDDTGGFTIYAADWDAGNEDGWDFGEATGTAGGTAGGGGPAGYGTAWLEIQSNATDAGHNARVDDIQTSPDRIYTFTVQIAGGGDYYLLAKDMESLDGWFVGEATAKVVNGPVAGDEALKVTTNTNDTNEVFHQVRKTFSTSPGSNYTFTALIAGTADYWLVARDMTAEGADFLSSESFIGGGGTVSPGGTSAYATATWEFTAPGSSTRFAIQTTQDQDVFYIGHVTINEGRDAESYGAIANDIYTATQAQANATALTWNFTDSVDSAGSAWSPATISITIPDGPPAGTLLDRGVGLGYEWRVVPAVGDEGYELEVFNSGGLGTDYTGLTSAPVIRQGGVILGGRSRQQVAKNVVRVMTAGGYWAESTDASSTAAVGRRVETIHNSQSSGTAIAQEFADARLAVHQAQIGSLWVELSEDATDMTPFVHFDVGDTIAVELGDVLGVSGYSRVRSIRADLQTAGNEMRYSVELQ